MEQEVLNLANKQVQLAMSNAFNCLTQISPATFQSRPVRPNAPLRYRSSSNTRHNRKIPFYNTIPRCSIPATKNDLVHYRARLLSYQQINQTRCQTSQNIHSDKSNRTVDVQYSFSLNKSWLTEINRKQHNFMCIQNFVNEFIEHSIQTALIQIVYHKLSDEDETSSVPIEHLQTINSYVDRFVHSTIEQAIDNITLSNIELFSNRLTEDILADAMSTIAYDEIYSRSTLPDNEKHLRRYPSSSIIQSLTNNSSFNEESIDSFVINIAQQIYINSFDELRQIFTKDNTNSSSN